MRKLLCVALLGLGACSGDSGRSRGGPPTGPIADAGNPDPTTDSGAMKDPEPCAKMDLVFIIDNSGSMGEEQTNLAGNFPKFIQVLNDFVTSAGDKLDYRVAVTTTGRDVDYQITLPPPLNASFPISEKGENGVFQSKMSCGMTRRWIQRTDPNADAAFSCIAKVGTSGPSIEMPLYAIKLALKDRIEDGTNAGFLRDDALLGIVILTDENDCSREDNNFSILDDSCSQAGLPLVPPADYVQFLDQLKLGRSRWATAVIAGAGPGKCTSSFGDAVEATRLKEFTNATGANAVFSSICDGDLTNALQSALETFSAACEAFGPIL